MSKSPCKGIKKDGTPCQGNGLDQFDGLCIAHGPSADQAHEWRSLGGKNSATAARLDKRIPERHKDLLDLLDDGMKQVKEGTLSPAAYTAICRGAQLQLEVYRLADEEMDLIRSEETQAAAAELAGAPANLDILEAAADIVTKQDRYRGESLVDQGFAELTESPNPDDPPKVILNLKGRERFGYLDIDFHHQLLVEVDDQLTEYDPKNTEYDPEKTDIPNVPGINDLLDTIVENIKETQSRLAQEPAAPFDPLNNQPITKLPSGVRVNRMRLGLGRCNEPPQEVMQDQLRHIEKLRRKTKELSEDEDYKRRWAMHENRTKEGKEAMAYIEAQKKKNPSLAAAYAAATV